MNVRVHVLTNATLKPLLLQKANSYHARQAIERTKPPNNYEVDYDNNVEVLGWVYNRYYRGKNIINLPVLAYLLCGLVTMITLCLRR